MMLSALSEENFEQAIIPLGGVNHMLMLDLPSILPHHDGMPLFYADETSEIRQIVEHTLKRGYLVPDHALEVLDRPLTFYMKKKNSLRFVTGKSSPLFQLQVEALPDVLRNFRSSRVFARMYNHDLYEVSETHVSFEVSGTSLRVVVPKGPARDMKPEYLTSTAVTMEDLKTLAEELSSPILVFNTQENQIALLGSRGGPVVTLDLTEIMDFVSFFT